jgi:hypothetical protein
MKLRVSYGTTAAYGALNVDEILPHCTYIIDTQWLQNT